MPLFKLVGCVAYISDIDSDNWDVTIIIAPVSYSSRQCDYITLTETVNPLVLISDPLSLCLSLLKLSRLLLNRLIGLWTAWKYQSSNTSPCVHKLYHEFMMNMIFYLDSNYDLSEL